MRKILEIDEELCNGCGQCVSACAEKAIQVVEGKARLVSESYCDGLGACLGECPKGAISIVEREAEEFDPEAVEQHLTEQENIKKAAENFVAAGCPSNHIQTFSLAPSGKSVETYQERIPSALSHWPVQIRLVPATAPFLKRAHLLVAADCTPIAYTNFHNDFLKDRVVLIGCPKFDDAQQYIQRFTEIFKTADIQSVTVVVMEVPCCQGLLTVIKNAMKLSGSNIPVEEIMISARGEILKKKSTRVYI